jgi:hypothetical protein
VAGFDGVAVEDYRGMPFTFTADSSRMKVPEVFEKKLLSSSSMFKYSRNVPGLCTCGRVLRALYLVYKEEFELY